MERRLCSGGRSVPRTSGIGLIEVLIACGLLVFAIYACLRILVFGMGVVGSTGCRLAAINLSRTQMEQIMRIPYANLPPQAIVVSRLPVMYGSDRVRCVAKLGQADIVDGSVRVRMGSREVPDTHYLLDPMDGTLYFSPAYANRALTVYYRFRMAHRLETLRVPRRPPYRIWLLDDPVEDSVSVTADGKSIALRGVDEATGSLVFHSRDAGRPVVVRYVSEGFVSTVEGKYLSADLTGEATVDTGNKEITLEQSWKDDHREKHLEFVCLRMR